MHRQNDPVVFYGSRDPLFARIKSGDPLPIATNTDLSMCTEIVHRIATKQWRPHYISINELSCASVRGGPTCSSLCQYSILSLKDENGNRLYTFLKDYSGINYTQKEDLGDKIWLKTMPYFLFKLDD